MSQNPRFKTGDVVQLKSGGPKMTVKDYDTISELPRLHVHCQWFAGSKLEHGRFPEDSLEFATIDKK